MSQTRKIIRLLPHGRIIETDSKRCLMEVLVDNNIFLRSDCGGKGVCGKCKVKISHGESHEEIKEACMLIPDQDISVEIPEASMLSPNIIHKPPVILPDSFNVINTTNKQEFGIAVDLGTTTIAVYLCDISNRKIITSVSIKNPQAHYGDDVMSRIGAISLSPETLERLQNLTVKAIDSGIKTMLVLCSLSKNTVSKMVVVGNPTMIHILIGIDPGPIGEHPYQPVFFESRKTPSHTLNFSMQSIPVKTLPQISGFIGGDILAAALAVNLENQPIGTLLVDLGTNGELILKGRDKLIATSCATGPAFEGATLSCGMQAIPGAIDNVKISSHKNLPACSIIKKNGSANEKAQGICGSGVISAIAEFYRRGIIEPGGRFNQKDTIENVLKDSKGLSTYVLVPGELSANGQDIGISQKDIRAIQLGKAALITGIEYLLKEAKLEKPEKIIIAGAFGSHMNKNDMITLGMLPLIAPEQIEIAGNAAGAGAVLTLCDDKYQKDAEKTSRKITVVDLAANKDFQNTFIHRLNFPESQ